MFLQLNPSWDGPIKQLLVDADTWLCKRRSGVFEFTHISHVIGWFLFVTINQLPLCHFKVCLLVLVLFLRLASVSLWVYTLTMWVLLQSWERTSRFCARSRVRLLPPFSDTYAYSTSSTTWPRPASSRGITSFHLVKPLHLNYTDFIMISF